MDEKLKIGVAEAFGTMFLVVGGCGTAIFAGKNIGSAGVAAAFGLSLLVMAYTIGHISGCHINPAVTLGMVLAGKVKPALAPIYVIGQIVGGLAGGLLLWITIKVSDNPLLEKAGQFASNGYGKAEGTGYGSPEGFGLGSVIIIEVLMTALLIYVVLGTTHKKFPAGFGGVTAGFTLYLIHLVSIPVSNTSVNPARSIAVAFFSDDNSTVTQLWAFIVFPLIGAVVGSVLWTITHKDDSDVAVAA